MAARAKQEFIPADAETQNQIEYGRKVALLEAQNPPPEIEPENEPDPDDIALQNVLAELGSTGIDAKVNIYQLDARQNRAFIGAFLPSEFSLERTQSEFGPGDYEIRVYNAGRLATRKVIKIAAPKNLQNQPANNPAPAMETQKVIETMNAGFQQLGQMFANALQSLAQNQPKPKTTIETLQEFQLMKEVFGGNQPAQPAQDPMSMITMALELSEKIRPREGEPSAGEIIIKAVENFAPTINQIMQSQAQNRTPVPPPLMGNPIPHVPQFPPQIPAPIGPQIDQSQPDENEMNIMFKVYAKTLIQAAASDAAPETYANNILDLLPEEKVLEFVNRADWFGEVVAALPEAAPHASWFAQLKDDILVLTNPDDAPSVEPNANIVPAMPATTPNAN